MPFILMTHYSENIFQAIGEIVDISGDAKLSVGQSVMYMLHGAFAEYKV